MCVGHYLQCHRSENFYAYFKEQKHYQNIIILNISSLKYNIFKNYFQSINSDFKNINISV